MALVASITNSPKLRNFFQVNNNGGFLHIGAEYVAMVIYELRYLYQAIDFLMITRTLQKQTLRCLHDKYFQVKPVNIAVIINS